MQEIFNIQFWSKNISNFSYYHSDFQTPATAIAEGLIHFHHDLMVFLVFILLIVILTKYTKYMNFLYVYFMLFLVILFLPSACAMEKSMVAFKGGIKLGCRMLKSSDVLIDQKFIWSPSGTHFERVLLQEFYAYNSQLFSCHYRALNSDNLKFDPVCDDIFRSCVQIVDSSKGLDVGQTHILLAHVIEFNEEYKANETLFHLPFCKSEIMLKGDFENMLNAAFLKNKDPLSNLHATSSMSTVKGEFKTQSKDLKDIYNDTQTFPQPSQSELDNLEAPSEKVNLGGFGFGYKDKPIEPSFTPFQEIKEQNILEWVGSFFKF